MPLAHEFSDPPFADSLLPDGPPDPAYPLTTPPDPLYPAQTRAPLDSPFDEIATPALWSRLARPLEHALVALWEALGLLSRARPSTWVAIHYGRIALNAHAWERLRARANAAPPDPTLVEPASGFAAALPERFEALRARFRLGRFERRLEHAAERREHALERLAALEPGDLDVGELARGPLDDRTWGEILVPWLGVRLQSWVSTEPDARLCAALALESSIAAELGQRLATRRVLAGPELVAYLTIEERIRAALDGSSHWSEVASQRRERVEQFAKLEVPLEFWGRPRVEAELA